MCFVPLAVHRTLLGYPRLDIWWTHEIIESPHKKTCLRGSRPGKKVNRKVQEEPQAEAAASPRHQEEEKINEPRHKLKQKTQTGLLSYRSKLESWNVGYIVSKGIMLSKQRTTKALIRLLGCAGWSASLLFAYAFNRFWHDVAQLPERGTPSEMQTSHGVRNTRLGLTESPYERYFFVHFL